MSGESAGGGADGIWRPCSRCGCLIADIVVHESWHAAQDGLTTEGGD